MITKMKDKDLPLANDLFLRREENQDKKEKMMVTAIVILTIFVLCLIISTYICCQKFIQANEKAATQTKIDENLNYQVQRNLKISAKSRNTLT